MAQVSYGTITITDTNDIESIVVEYARNQSTSSAPDSQTGGWSTTRPTWAQGYYIWQRTRIHKSGTDTSEDEFGTAVCITGSTGQTGEAGRSLTATETKYTNVASGTTQSQVEALAENLWVANVPSYDSSKPDYWIRVKNTYDKTPTTEYIYYKDNATGESLYNAAMANSIAQNANENANGAMSQANNGIKEIYRVWYRTNSSTTPNKPSTHVTETSNNVNNTWTKVKPIEDSNYCYYFYCEETITNGGVSSWTNPVLDITTLSKYEVEALDSRTKTFFFPGDSSYPGAYVVGKDSNDGLDKTDISTYGFNTRVTTTGISIGYNAAKVLHLKTTPSPASLDFYKPPTISGNTVTEGELAASLSTTGLILSKGGVKAGTAGQSGFIYLSTENYGSNLTINSHQASNWREIIGTKFGVDADGNLYASNAEISGKITVGSGSNVYTKTEADNTFDELGAANTAESNAIATAATDATNKANAVANSAAYEEQYIYISKVSGTGSVTKNETWVTRSDDVQNIWTTKRPTYDSNYPILFIAKQKKTVGQSSGTTCSCTTPIKDDTITVIDGGHITTGTIDASKLNVTAINASEVLTIGALSSTTQNSILNSELADDIANAEANASYSIEVKITDINYTNNSATLVAIPYYQGSTTLPTLPSGASYSYRWYKGTTALSDTSTEPTINGATTTTLILGEGSDLEAIYICVISKP